MTAKVGSPADDEGATEGEESSSAGEFLRELAFAPPIAPPAVEHDRAGEVLGHFELLRLLGRGGMGVVYAAHDLGLRRQVAIKLLSATAVESQERRQRFLREARATAAVNHPNIATVHEVGEIGGEIFIAMELVDGRSLRSVLREAGAALPEAEAVRIAREIARGLAAAHQAGIVHRDIKPENVIIGRDGGVKLIDFGLAKQRSAKKGPDARTASDLTTREGHILGSPNYMSPEQAHGLPADARSDVFALGVVLYELLTGERPFHGTSPLEVFAAIIRDPPRPLASKNPFVSKALANVVSRCLAKDPSQRFVHAGELLAALDAVAPPSEGRPVHPSWRRRWMLGVVPAVAVASAAAWLTLRTPGERPRPMTITDLPLPTSSSPEAIAAYKVAVQSLRDANWDQAKSSLRGAIERDPTLAAAHLRLAMVLSPPNTTNPLPEALAAYREATRFRSALTARDRGLLSALEPALSADPPDIKEATRRLAELTELHPFDAELFFIRALYQVLDAPDLRLRSARRAVELDPEYADAWQIIGTALVETDTQEGLAALERCTTIAPTAVDCWAERAYIESALGQCTSAEAHFRRASNHSSTDQVVARKRAFMLYALGKPSEAVAEALQQGWARLEPSMARQIELQDRALLAAAYGDFKAAKAYAEQGLALVDSLPSLRDHAIFTLLLTDVALETGHGQAATPVVEDFLRRRDGWRLSTPADDPAVYLTRILARTGVFSKAEVRARRDAWYGAALSDAAVLKAVVWVLAYVRGIEHEDEAAEALEALPKDATWWRIHDFDWIGADLGRALWLGGRRDEALPHLERAFTRCDRFPHILHAMRTDLLFGRALEERGERDRACEVYRAILVRWGKAKPRSVTADEAKERARALGCSAVP